MQPFKRLTQLLSDIAALAIAAMAFLTIADIVMKNVFNRPIKGTFEIVEFLLVFVVFFGVVEVFRSDSNICVDLADQVLTPKRTSVLKAVGMVASLLFLALMGFAMISPAMDTVVYPQWTQEMGIPLYAYWAPILAGTTLATIAVAAVIVMRLSSPATPDEA